MSYAAWIESVIGSAEWPCTLIISEKTEANLRWANNAITTNGQMHSVSATAIVYQKSNGDWRYGQMNGPIATVADLQALYEDAAEQATSATAAPDASDLVNGGVDEDFAADASGGGIDLLADIASGLARATVSAKDTEQLLFGFAEHHQTTIWLGSSAGTRRRAVTQMGRLELNAKRPDMIASAWVGRTTQDFSDVDFDEAYAEVSKRLSWCDQRLELPAGEYEVILPPSAVADLLIYAYWTMSRRDASDGHTVFSGGEPGTTKEGQRLTELPITLASDPKAAEFPMPDFAVVTEPMPGLISVFDNGRPVQPETWIDKGVLRNLITQGASGELHFPTENLIAQTDSETSLESMISNTKRGLLLTCLWYIREVDPETLLLTGLTRDGVYLIEDGEVKGMVNNFRFNESPISLLRRATDASASVKTLPREWNDWFTRTTMPALRIPDFRMSTVSKAY